MNYTLFANKLGMTSYIDENGHVFPVTLISLLDQEPLFFQKLSTNGYNAVVVGYSNISEKKLNNSKKGFFKKIGKSPKKYLSEIRLPDSLDEDSLSLDDFNFDINIVNVNDNLKVVSTSKGKGFLGTIAAHRFKRGPMTHGSKNHRLPGSIGAGTDPARVFKGTKMAKRVGNIQVTKKNLTILKVDIDNKLIYIKGSIPGKKSQLVKLMKMGG